MGLWDFIRELRPAPAQPVRPIVLQDFDDDEREGDDAPPTFAIESVSGYSCHISYSDSKGRVSERRVSCQRLDRAGAHHYLAAYCHERRALRQFRLDRVVAVIDLATGEVFDPGSLFFDRFSPDREQATGLSWGLSPSQKATLVAGLNVLTFLGRCDGHYDDLEIEEVEAFAERYWLRAELPGDPPMEAISSHIERLRPDAETFYVSLERCLANVTLAGMLGRSAQGVIEADGSIHAKETYWGSEVLTALRQAGRA